MRKCSKHFMVKHLKKKVVSVTTIIRHVQILSTKCVLKQFLEFTMTRGSDVLFKLNIGWIYYWKLTFIQIPLINKRISDILSTMTNWYVAEHVLSNWRSNIYKVNVNLLQKTSWAWVNKEIPTESWLKGVRQSERSRQLFWAFWL